MQVSKRLRQGLALLTAAWLFCTAVAAETTPAATTAATTAAATTAAATTAAATTGVAAATEPTAPTAPEEPQLPAVPYRTLIDADAPLDAGVQWWGLLGEENYENAHFEEGRNGKKALRFDGTQYMRVDFRERQTPFTLSFFVNWQADLSDAQTAAQHLFSVKLQNGEDGLFCLPDAKETMQNGDVINGLLLRAVCYDKSGWQRQSFYYPAAHAVSNALPAFTWHHIAFVAEERRVTLYLDGLLWKTAELSFDYSAMKADTLLIGANDTASVRFTGLMQDMRLYDGVLTAEQVCRLAKDADPFDATVAVTPASYAPTAAKEAVTEKSYVAKTADGKTGVAAAGDAFWEMPQLDAGQSVTGTLTVENRSKHTVDMALAAIVLPEKGTAAWDYLASLQLTVQRNGETLFSGPYTAVTAKKPDIAAAGLSYSRKAVYTVTLSRGFESKGGVVAVQVPWQMTVTLADAAGRQPREGRHIALLVMLLLSAAALIAGVYFAVEKRVCPFFGLLDAVRKKHLQPLVKKCAAVLQRRRKKEDDEDEKTP